MMCNMSMQHDYLQCTASSVRVSTCSAHDIMGDPSAGRLAQASASNQAMCFKVFDAQVTSSHDLGRSRLGGRKRTSSPKCRNKPRSWILLPSQLESDCMADVLQCRHCPQIQAATVCRCQARYFKILDASASPGEPLALLCASTRPPGLTEQPAFF